MSLPVVINPGDVGHIGHHEDIHSLLNKAVDWPGSELGAFAQGLLANRPAAGEADRWYYASDVPALYRDNGITWVKVALAGADTSYDGDQLFTSGRPWIDLIGKGADPTGAVAASTAFQDAVDDAEALAATTANGADVYVPPGTFLLDGNDMIRVEESHVGIVGAGDASVIFIDGDWYVGSGGSSGIGRGYIRIYNATKTITGCSVRRLRFLSTYDRNTPPASHQFGGPNIASYAVLIGGSLASVGVHRSGVIDCTFENCGGEAAIGFNGGTNTSAGPWTLHCYAINNRIYDCSGSGINAVSGGVRGTLVAHNTIQSVGQIGIEWSGMQARVVDNDLIDVDSTGISFEQATGHIGWTICSGNTMYSVASNSLHGDTPGAGIQIGQNVGIRTKVIGNTIERSYGVGIAVSGGTRNHVVIEHNTVLEFGYDGDGKTLVEPSWNWTGIYAGNGTNITVTNNEVHASNDGNANCEYGYIVGGDDAEDCWTDDNRAYGTYTTRAFYLPSSLGRLGYGTRVHVGENNLHVSLNLYAGRLFDNGGGTEREWVPTLEESATPTVAGMPTVVHIYNNSAFTITNLLNGVEGQQLLIYVENSASSILAHNANIVLMKGANYTLVNGDVIHLVRVNGVWREVKTTS